MYPDTGLRVYLETGLRIHPDTGLRIHPDTGRPEGDTSERVNPNDQGRCEVSHSHSGVLLVPGPPSLSESPTLGHHPSTPVSTDSLAHL